ncbi:MAG: P-loop NTPase fold protein [Rhodopila sp.]
MATSEPGEDATEWRTILGLSEPARPTVTRFESDRPSAGGGDPLEIGLDVQALARVICLEQAAPPLSIGLFGPWGSGKSTFMERLEHEIEAIAASERTRRDRAGPPSPDQPNFIANVVQIRFNAWHFADANLWASLTAEFFDQLRAGGFARTGNVLHARLVARVNAHIHALRGQVDETRR